MKKMFQKAKLPFTVSFLFCFMLLIFGPAEIFFANVIEFQFIYQEFGFYMIILALILSVVMTVIGVVLPDKIRRVYLSVILGVSLAGYLQIMFFNKKLDLLGLNPNGYQISKSLAIGNLIPWTFIIGIVIFISFWKCDLWKKAITYIASFLLVIQGVAFISLLITAKNDAYHYPEGELYLSGENQFQVSQNENVIVIVLDFYSNSYIEDDLLRLYPGATDFLHDFTYYDNVECNYFGTFPSLVHMFTGYEYDMTVPVNDWFQDAWTNDKTVDFYDQLHEKGYVVNFYTPEANIVLGLNSMELMEDKFDNISSQKTEYVVNTKLLIKTLTKMSSYRMAPEMLKAEFYTRSDEYSNIVRNVDMDVQIVHQNAEFYENLRNRKISTDTEKNYFIIQHLEGMHEWTTDENGMYTENGTLEGTEKGCMVVVEEYLQQLKSLGVYDNSTIIITADHGDRHLPQVIFYMKQAGEQHEVSPVNHAPVSHNELLPTMAEIAGLEAGIYGQTIFDFGEDDQRERIYWLREYRGEYPEVRHYCSEKNGESNVYFGYRYVGGRKELMQSIQDGEDLIIPMIDSFF